jgi:acyl-CoA reductase-like NAD-dependent aldehyde dehydrogenase
MRRVALELGGNGPTILCEDAVVGDCAPLCARNAMRLAGQSCISVQSVYAHERIYDAFVARLVEEVGKLKLGDPIDPATDVGTLIDEAAAVRVESWLREAEAGGARVLTGGRRHGAAIEPAVVVDVQPQMKVVCDEVFGPVVTVQPFRDLEGVIDRVNASRFGLHCGVFTQRLDIALHCARTIRTGGVIINGTSTWRTDQLPYGGIRDSGQGREGPHYSMREMTEERLVVFNL